jgi:hypothetical protein
LCSASSSQTSNERLGRVGNGGAEAKKPEAKLPALELKLPLSEVKPQTELHGARGVSLAWKRAE